VALTVSYRFARSTAHNVLQRRRKLQLAQHIQPRYKHSNVHAKAAHYSDSCLRRGLFTNKWCCKQPQLHDYRIVLWNMLATAYRAELLDSISSTRAQSRKGCAWTCYRTLCSHSLQLKLTASFSNRMVQQHVFVLL
jgi:hypothetical protein